MEHKLTRQDTNLLKGLAIVGIILHNFCHMLPRIVAENEYTYHTFKNAQLLGSLRKAYRLSRETGDRRPLSAYAEETFPMLQAELHDLMLAHRTQWMRDYKPQGWEMLAYRYGGAMARLEDAAMAVADYVRGVTDSIPELEEETLPQGANFCFFHSLTSAGAAFHP